MAACGGSEEETLPSIQPTPTQPDEDEESGTATSMKMNIIVGDRTITATMEDNAAAQDFLSRLPLEVMLNDFNNTTEKIFYPNPALTVKGVKHAVALPHRRHYNLCAVGQRGDFLQELVA